MKNLSLDTFGNTTAALRLVEMINERDFKPSKITRITSIFDLAINHTNHIDLTIAIYLIRLVYEDSLRKCDALETPFNTYTKNVLTARYRIWQLRKNTQKPKKNRIK